jgi:kynurenine formamidase
VLLILGLSACYRVDQEPGTVSHEKTMAVVDLASAHLVDLTHPYDAETIYWPTSPSDFELERLAYGETEGGYFYSANAFSTPEHGGTHIDAPIHFAAERYTVDEIPLERLVGPAVVIDIQHKASTDSDYRLTVEDVTAWEADYGQIPEGAIVMLYTGWDSHWPDRKKYLGDNTPGEVANLSFPSYGPEAAKLLVEERQVSALGVDTASIDYGRSKDFMVHRIANNAEVSGLENVANLGRMPARGAWVVALPMKIAGGSGGPVRILGVIPTNLGS